MSEVKEVFEAKASSVLETFQTEMGVASFRIPIYQRQFSWDYDNIDRLLDDIKAGINSLHTVKDYMTFVGTILLVDDGNTSESTFDGKSLSVVDGQQRLTTISIICCELHHAINEILKGKEKWPQDILSTIIEDEAQYLSDYLFTCCLGKGPMPRTVYDYFPRVVREEFDIRAATPHEVKYKSPIAEYLFNFGKHVINQNSSKFVFNPSSEADIARSFKDRLDYIIKYINQLSEVDEKNYIELPNVYDLLHESKNRQILFPKLQQKSDKIHDVLEILKSETKHPAIGLIKMIAFGNYLLYRVAITQVVADNEQYAFDIFEALNTTGEPLTALETFKPNVIQFENSLPEKYTNSPSYKYFCEIEDHIRQFTTYDSQTRESREMIVLLALYVSGKKEGNHLNNQRRYLKTEFNNAKSPEGKRRIISALADIANYRNRFWDKVRISYQLRDNAKKEIALFCLSFIRDLNNSLAIPVLVRYWKYSELTNDSDIFINAVKAITAFIVIRRSATGGTYGIDDDLRKLMSKEDKVGNEFEILKLGIDHKENLLPSIIKLKSYLVGFLKDPRLKIQTKEDWINRVSQQPLYKTGPACLCRFILFCATHNSVPDKKNPYLLKKERQHPGRNYLTLDDWRSENHQTLEHIAPQNKSQGWDTKLYEDLNLIHFLGNLTLLPEKENAAIGDKPWNKKKLFFQAAAAETNEDVDNLIQKAKDQGIKFGKKLNHLLIERGCLPVVTTVGNTEIWNKKIVRERTKNIVTLLWDELSGWIGKY